MGERIITIAPPYLGKVTRTSLQDMPKGALYDCLDIVPFDPKTERARLSVRPGFSALGSLSGVTAFHTMPAPSATYGMQVMAATTSALHGWNGTTWGMSVGTFTSTTGRAIHMASYGIILYIACDTSGGKYKKYTQGGSMTDWYASTAGTIPDNCRLICEWGARIVLAGDPANPQVVNMSRVDDPTDWSFGDEDTGSAVSGPVAGAVTAVIPHNRQCLVVGFLNGMQMFRGNPTNGGSLEWLSHVVGPISGKAWCKSPDDFTYILTHDGLYRMAPGCGSPPEAVSRNLIPDSLLGLDGVNYQAYLGYDERFQCIHIYIEHSSLSQRWLFDVRTGGFWPISSPGSGILAVHRYGPADSATASGTLIGTSSGVQRFDNAVGLSGGTAAFAKFVFPLQNEGDWATIRRANFVFASNTNDTAGTVIFYGGESAQDAIAAGTSRKSSHAISALMANHGNCFPRIGGQSVLVHMTHGGSSYHLALEKATIHVTDTGRERG